MLAAQQFFNLKLATKIFVFFGAIIVLLYTIPLKNNKNLRDVKGFKIFLVVIGWLSLVVGVPISMAQKFDIDLFFQLLMIQGIYIFVATIPFEIRDLDQDQPNALTIAQILGISNVKLLGYLLLIINLIFTFFSFGVFSAFSLSSAISFLSLILLLYIVTPTHSKYLTSFWVESIPIFWSVIYYLINFSMTM